jgi:carboxyl-terminal processing protease
MTKRLLAVLLFVLAADAPAAVPDYTPAMEGRVFDRAWKLVADKYWDRSKTGTSWLAARDHYRPLAIAAPDRPAFYTILGEMLASLGDSHVYAIDPKQVAIEKEREAGKSAQGFGFDMLPDDDGIWRVISLRDNGPARTAGVEIGWEVRGVNGRPVDIDYQPEPGETASFDFADEDGKTHSIRIASELEEPLPPRRATRLAGNILLVGLDGFDGDDAHWIADTLREQPAPAGVILDLRRNGGGDAEVIARVAGLFFAENRPLVIRVGQRRAEQGTRGAGPGSWLGPLAVLIGPDSASGAEALAALIDETGRGVTVGQRTAGALTGASDYRLPDGGELSVAEFDIRTPGGKRLEGVGLTPRIAVTPSLADRRAGRDPVLDRARSLLSRQTFAATGRSNRTDR